MVSEAVYVINLNRVYWTGRYRRLAKAVKAVREFIKRHTKAKSVILDSSINEYIYSRAYDRPPRRVAVKVLKIDEGVYKATLALEVR